MRRRMRPLSYRTGPTIRACLLAVLALLATAPSARAQIAAEEYEARRDSLAARMGSGVLIAFGAPDFVGHHFEMRQLPAFDYLTGFREPDAVFVMVAEGDGHRGALFIHTPSVRTQLYDGFREAPASLAERTGFAVMPLEELPGHVERLAESGLPFFELRDFETADYAARDSLTRGAAFMERLRERHPDLEITNAHPWVSALRARKSPAERALLRRAIEITDRTHMRALEVIRPGAYEYEVEAAIEHAFRSLGADGPAYSSIVGSGPNSTILHYVANDRRMEAGDLVVMDVGAAVDGYAADITRTAPVTGRFTPEQREIYDLVLEAQKAAERRVAPGQPAAASLEAATAVRLEGLTRLGLIESPTATFDPPWPVDCDARPNQCLQGMLFMIHGISHGIGLEVHDPTQFYTGPRTYGVGDVFTIEPGLYISTRALELLEDTPKNRAFVAAVRAAVERYDEIGVRIEDDYLVTAEGYERLSTGSPREAEEVEAAMARVFSVTGLDGPEAVRYDPDQDVYFIASFGESGSQPRDSNGYISRIDAADGRVQSQRFMTGTAEAPLHMPRGMFIRGDTLWVADMDGVHGFDRATGRHAAFIDFREHEPGFLNDIAVGPDGLLYVTDTGRGRVYRVRADGRVELAIEDERTGPPNGITWDPRRSSFLLAPWGREMTLRSWDPVTGEVRDVATLPGGRFDGIEMVHGGALVASQDDRTLHLVHDDGRTRPLIRVPGRPADIGVDTRRGRVAVPYIALGRVDVWTLAP